MELKKVDINRIRALMGCYGIPDTDTPDKPMGLLSDRLAQALSGFWKNYQPFYDWQVEVALLIQFLKACKGSDIVLKGTITNPQGKQVKGSELTAKLSANNSFKTDLEELAATWLDRQLNFSYDDLQDMDIYAYPLNHYTEQVLEIIIRHLRRTSKIIPQRSKNGELGEMADYIKTLLEPYGLNITQTKLYSFIYDIMLLGEYTGKTSITDEGFSSGIGREKSQQVRNWLNAYVRDMSRID